MSAEWMFTRLMLSAPLVVVLSFFAEWLYNSLKAGKPIPKFAGSE
jgi:hypothetical protein